MSVDYTRKHQWTKNPKGSRYRKPYMSSTRHLAEKYSRERNKSRKTTRKIIQRSCQTEREHIGMIPGGAMVTREE
jgi:hypothetical protein